MTALPVSFARPFTPLFRGFDWTNRRGALGTCRALSFFNTSRLRYRDKSSCTSSTSTKPVFTSLPRDHCILAHVCIAPLHGQNLSIRFFSSTKKGSRKQDSFKLDALPFTVSPDEAMEKFKQWCNKDQGIRLIVSSVDIGAAYVPVWSFDVNVRFKTEEQGRVRYDLKPEPLTVYGSDVVYLPGVSSYAGYDYRRSLVDPVHNTSLIFLGDQTVPFASWMLKEMATSDGQTVTVSPDPWNATRSRSFAVVLDELESLASSNEASGSSCHVQTEVVGARRVYMPTFVITYRVLGAEYQAFVSGCDRGGDVSGVSHTVFSSSETISPGTFLQGTAQIAQRLGGPLVLVYFGQQVLVFVFRILARIPLVGVLGGGFVAFRKLVRPWMDDRSSTADWERQRDHEAQMKDSWTHSNDFFDGGNGKRYFERNKERIRSYLGGEHDHSQGDFDWYQQWEQWAQEQWREQQRTQHQYEDTRRKSYDQQYDWQQRQQRERQQTQAKQKPKQEYKWDFNPNDPYSVLGIKRGATKDEVSKAFRREMLKYHPDTQSNAPQTEKDKNLERSKLITEAYRNIKKEMK